MLSRSSGINAMLILEGKTNSAKTRA